MVNANVKKNCGAVYYAATIISMLLIIAADIVYWVVPDSELANGIEHSGMDAVYVLAAACAASILALALYIAGSLIDKAIVSNSVVQKIIFAISVVTIVITAAVTLGFTLTSGSIGFVAPIDSTKWQSLGIVSVISTVMYIGANIYIFATGKKN